MRGCVSTRKRKRRGAAGCRKEKKKNNTERNEGNENHVGKIVYVRKAPRERKKRKGSET